MTALHDPQTTWPAQGTWNNPIIHNIIPQTSPSLQYVLFSLPNKTFSKIFNFQTIRECLEGCKASPHDTIKVTNKLNWTLKKKSLIVISKMSLHALTPLFLFRKSCLCIFTPPTPNIICLGGHHCWRLAGMSHISALLKSHSNYLYSRAERPVAQRLATGRLMKMILENIADCVMKTK